MNRHERIVVTGGNGFLGSSVMRKLKECGYVNVFTFRSSKYNLTKDEEVERMIKELAPDIIIHLAAVVGGIGANRANPGKFAYDNLAMGLHIVEGCRRNHISKLIIAGTVCGYPKFTPVPFKEEDFWNGYPEETNAPYGIAKKTILVLAEGYRQQYGLNYTFLLPVNLFGPGDHYDLENCHVIPAMIRRFHEAKVEKKENVILWGDGSPSREFLYVDDCASAFVKAMETKENVVSPVNIGSGNEISMLDLANKIKAIVGYEGIIVWDKSKPNGQPRRCLDVSKAEKTLGWKSKTAIDEGLRLTYSDFITRSKDMVI